MIRFYGLKDSLTKWSELVKLTTGKDCSPIQQDKGRFFFAVNLTPEDRAKIQSTLWYAESGTGHTATNRPYRWNDCVSFMEVKPKKS